MTLQNKGELWLNVVVVITVLALEWVTVSF